MRAPALPRRVAADDLYRGSLLLLANNAVLAAFGFVFWAVAAHVYRTDVVGSFAALNAAVGLLSALASLGLPNTVLRHLGSADDARRLMRGVLLAVGTLGGALCLAFVVLLGPYLPASLHLRIGAADIAIVVGLVVLTAFNAATDAGLVALRDARSVVVKNLAGSVVKVLAIAPLHVLGDVGLVAAFGLGGLVATPLGVRALWRRMPRDGAAGGALATLRRHATFSVGNYVGLIFGILPLTVVPLIVVAHRGTREAAWFAMAFLIVGFLNFIPATTSQVLFAESARGGEGAWRTARKAAVGIYALLLPCLAALLVGAPQLLRLFGGAYGEHAGTCLQVMGLATLFTGGTYLIDAVLASRDRVSAYIFMNVVNAVLVLTGVSLFVSRGLSSVALGWALAQGASLVIGLVVLVVVEAPRRGGVRPAAASRPIPATRVPAPVRTDAVTSTGLHRLAFLDGLRGVAALYVVVSHVWDTVFAGAVGADARLKTVTAFLGFGRYAVAVFIVVSGFSLGLAAWKHGLRWPGGSRRFFRRRITRIYPPYLAALALSALLGATILSHHAGTLYDGAIPIRTDGVLSHALLLQDVAWRGPAGSTAFWSIAVEFHIYFFFAAVLVAMRRWSQTWLWAFLALAGLTAITVMFDRFGIVRHAGLLYPSLYGLFLLGVAASRAAVPNAAFSAREWNRLMCALSALGVVLEIACVRHFDPLGPLNDLWLGPLVAMLVVALTQLRLGAVLRLLTSRVALWLGDASYSLYLLHPVALEVVWRWLVDPLGLPTPMALILEMALGVVASVLVARIFYLAIERPCLRGLRGAPPPVPGRPPRADPVAPEPQRVVADPSVGLAASATRVG